MMLRAALLILASFGVAEAHDIITTKITWSKEVSRLVYKRCASCHRKGGSAFSLMTYEESRPWAKAIKEEVLERRMPPWGAVKGFGGYLVALVIGLILVAAIPWISIGFL